jgi:uncharacterized membrane protein YkoI
MHIYKPLIGATMIIVMLPVCAENIDQDTVAAIKERLVDAKISLAQAITSAETQVGGRAIEAELDEGDQLVYEIEILKDDQLVEVQVNGRDGKILDSTVESPEHDKKHHECDE